MNLNEIFPVSPAKIADLKARIAALGILPSLIQEEFTRGGGHGGQKINKTSNAVRLHYPPMNITVKVQRERQRSVNRFLALRELVDQIEERIVPGASPRGRERTAVRKQKDRRRRRFKKRMG